MSARCAAKEKKRYKKKKNNNIIIFAKLGLGLGYIILHTVVGINRRINKIILI
jgi:hypothetical protein